MKLREVYKKTVQAKTNRGFSVIEMLVVAGVVVVLAGLTVPVGFRYYQVQILNESTQQVFDVLRRAQQNSLFQKNDSSFGVRVDDRHVTLFQGSEFVSRNQDQDEVLMFPDSVVIGGVEEIVFSKKYGTTTSAEISITSNGLYEYITVNTDGIIVMQ